MFEQRLCQLEQQHLLRRLRTIESASEAEVTLEGRPVILMASNNYLGLATHPALKRAAIQATERFGVGAGAARLVSGTLPPHEELETTLAKFKGTEAALAFGSGYLANLGVIPALIGAGGLIFADRLCHASLIDGCRLSGASLRVYRHNDVAHLKSLLARRPSKRDTLIVTDGVFSMDGDLAPLPDLIELADRYNARLFVDDAHGTGVMGAQGRGTIEHFGLESRIPFHMGTLGKALGTSGAYVVGPSAMIQYLINTARTFLFATAPPPATAAAAIAGLQVLRNEPERRVRLWENRQYLHAGLTRLGFRLTGSASPILPIVVGNAQKAVAMADRLLELGVYAPAIRPPTVPKNTSRIRVTVTSEHSRTQLDRALEAFGQAGREVRVC
ncbi:MAG: 8-amino-7-oxononanoate synthase [Nitrospirae bacterium RIFCSPLOWO2_02_FULL_62_14]|nr:MAG: 8-amino-7-oxononanoate synthase [Nitrospirae bacterium RIFCSPLOWO2_02_FULL_62_14]OGW70187.1 MAG: 8-amino-7-oxononanoate synthase [Nitrospirae bacterium RIFCSPLOWO2_01_FULL_62_17]